MAKQLKEIEIPLGAKDSELCGWEYTIPEGMEATIVDNKIVVKKKESEDEKVRKFIIKIFKDSQRDGISEAIMPEQYDKIFAWLKKHGETFTKKDVDDAYLKGVCDAKHELEKQGEQKPADKVEPKFHEGDWVVFNGLTLYVKEVVKGFYRTITKGGIINSYDWNIDNVARLWTIEDAKDGDVLADNLSIILFRKIGNAKHKNVIDFYGNTNKGRFEKQEGFEYWGDVIDCTLHPATKEQRDTLIKAMVDAGYTFNFDKKELRKLKFRVGDIVKRKSQPMLDARKIISIGKDCYWCEDRGCIGFAWEYDYELVEQKPA